MVKPPPLPRPHTAPRAGSTYPFSLDETCTKVNGSQLRDRRYPMRSPQIQCVNDSSWKQEPARMRLSLFRTWKARAQGAQGREGGCSEG
eukprot:6175166-Pleurochrysis_carterae.AAC.3